MIDTVSHRIAILVLATGTAATPALAGPGQHGGIPAHDGTWSVELVTETGLCSARYNYAVAIRDGEVRPVAASGGARVSGRVSADGTVGITVAGAGGAGTGTGRLNGTHGSGTWAVSSLCSGHWTARRGDNRTAQAE